MTGTEVARIVIERAQWRRDVVADFYETAARIDEEEKGADAYWAELRAELGDWLYRTDQAEFQTYTDSQGREHAEF